MKEKSMILIYNISNSIIKLVKINMIWFIINLPIFIIVTIVGLTQLINQLLIFLFWFLIPILLFPSTAAMFSMVNQWLNDRDSNIFIQKYLSYFLRDYKKVLKSGFILTIVMLIMIVDLIFFIRINNTIMIFATLFTISLIFLFIINFLVTNSNEPILRISTLFKRTLIKIIKKPILSILVLLSNILIIFVSFEFIIIIPFFTGVTIALVSYSIYKAEKINYSILKKKISNIN